MNLTLSKMPEEPFLPSLYYIDSLIGKNFLGILPTITNLETKIQIQLGEIPISEAKTTCFNTHVLLVNHSFYSLKLLGCEPAAILYLRRLISHTTLLEVC